MSRFELEEALLGSTTMVTEFLEALSGEPIDAERIRHQTVTGGAESRIAVEEGHELIHRTAVLRGRVTANPYVYAESFIVYDRLPEAICEQLDHTNTPIGRALAACGLRFQRVLLPAPRGHPMDADEQLLTLIRRADLKRAYLIVIDDVPVIAIDEWFLPATVERHRCRS